MDQKIHSMSDFWQFLVAVFWRWQSWLGGTGVGGAIVVLVGLYERLANQKMPKQVYIGIFIGAFLLSAFFLAWRDERKKLQEFQDNADAPYLVLDYLLVQNGASGLTIRNEGKEYAVHVRIGDVRLGTRVAKFGEINVVRTGGQPYGTYPVVVEHGPGEEPPVANDLHYVIQGLPVDAKGIARFEIIVEYWATDEVRKFKTTCTVEYRRNTDQIDFLRTKRELISRTQ